MRSLPTVLSTSFLLLGLGCDASTPAPDAAVSMDDAPTSADDAFVQGDAPMGDAGVVPGTITIGPAERPARMVVPPQHDGTTPLPIVVLLHGYSASATVQDAYFGTTRLARELGFYLILPDGTMDAGGNRFWNAGACCDFGGVDVDDVGYLTGLLDDAEARVPVDTTRVYFMGHSNGGFMSYRMACSLADRITAVAALAGTEASTEPCEPTRPVSVLHIHGTADATISYAGGSVGGAPYRSADDEITAWQMRNACDASMSTSGGTRDYDAAVAGEETTVTTWSTCAPGTTVELWRMEGSGHIPGIGGATGGASRALLEWLLARRAS
jgi:polyhydroxybutyrate depolymerase